MPSDLTDLERACDEMLSDLDKIGDKSESLNEEDAQYWRSEYWAIKDEYDQLVDQIETLVRKYCQ